MNAITVRQLGIVEYEQAFKRQKAFIENRTGASFDEIWSLEHQPVYTLGLAGKPEHILNQNTIPVCQSDRGGQVSYHGPGQLIIYLLLDLKRLGIAVKRYVFLLEEAIISMLVEAGLQACRMPGAPGVYVNEKKIAALGIRIRNGCCYHGISLNVDMDLSPFQDINPCGYPGLEVTQLADLGVKMDVMEASGKLIPYFIEVLGCSAQEGKTAVSARVSQTLVESNNTILSK